VVALWADGPLRAPIAHIPVDRHKPVGTFETVTSNYPIFAAMQLLSPIRVRGRHQ